MELADRHVWVIEDAAESHGAIYHGRKTGGLGHAGCFSFYANNVLLLRSLQRLFASSDASSSDIKTISPLANAALLRLSQLELAWLKVAGLPFGVNLLVLAEKPALKS